MTPSEALQQAFEQHRSGQLDHAEQAYRQILAAEPQNVQALHLMGLVAHQRGRHAAAIDYITRAILFDGTQPSFYANLSTAQLAMGRVDDAIVSMRQVIQMRPDHPKAHNDLGVLLANLGRWREAEECFRAVLRIQPDYGPAHNNLGNILNHQGRGEEAIACFRTALRLAPTMVEAYNNLGSSLRSQGHLAESIEQYREALRIAPNYADGYYNLAIALKEQDKPDEAIVAYREALRIRPDFVEAQCNLGGLFRAQGLLPEALASFEQVLAARPDFAEAHHALGGVLRAMGRRTEARTHLEESVRLKPNVPEPHQSLGNLLFEEGQFDRAIAHFRAAIEQNPQYADPHISLGAVLQYTEKPQEAEACYRRALELDPGNAGLDLALAMVLHMQRRLDEAQTLYDKRCGTKMPDNAKLYRHWGECFQAQGQWAKAAECYERAIALEPDYAEVHYNLGTIWLTQGNFTEAAWSEFEWRLKGRTAWPNDDQPIWDGRDLQGEPILVHAEMGLGDTLHFARYVPLVKQRGGDVILGVQKVLLPLFHCSGFEKLLPMDSPFVDFPCHWRAPLVSLPGIFGTTQETIPANVPYLSAEAELVQYWRKKLQSLGGFKVAIAWGGSNAAAYTGRSMPLRYWESLARVPGVHLISLQKRDGVEELASVRSRFEVIDLAGELDESHGAFIDTAAIMSAVDAVISSDTATAHLAGALGVNTWVGLAKAAEWRWLEHRDDSPWYPTMRLFRQTRLDDWTDVLERMAEELARLVQTGHKSHQPEQNNQKGG